MKFNAAFITLAVLVASATAAPQFESRGIWGSIKNGASNAADKASSAANTGAQKLGSGAGSVANGYNNNAGSWNALGGTGAAGLALAGQGLTAEANNEKDDQAQRRAFDDGRGMEKRLKSSFGKGYSGTTSSNKPKPSTDANAPASASGADKITSGNNAINWAAGGLGVWNADQALQDAQEPQQKRSPLGWQAAGEVALMGAMGGGPSFSSSKSTGQQAGNGNVHVTGASSKRDLGKRLFSFDSSKETSQSAGNGNVHISGASSGGSTGNPKGEQILAQMQQQAGAQQKQQKRLFSFSDDKQLTQQAGNGNVHVSGASSGGNLFTPEGAASLNAGTAAAASQGH